MLEALAIFFGGGATMLTAIFVFGWCSILRNRRNRPALPAYVATRSIDELRHELRQSREEPEQ